MSRTAAPLRTVAAALSVLIALLGAGAVPAAAAEAEAGAATEEQEHGGSQSIREIGTQSKTAQEFLPEEAELPPFQRFLYIPLFIVGLIVIVLLLFRHLQWQPRFAEERRSKRRR